MFSVEQVYGKWYFYIVNKMELIKKWSREDNKRSLREGWGIFAVDDGVVKILKYDESNRFSSDDEAQEHVNRNAKRGGYRCAS